MKMGPLAGLKVIEMAGIGPGPMALMMLSDMGARCCGSSARLMPPSASNVPKATICCPVAGARWRST